jgi:hypothetical protein
MSESDDQAPVVKTSDELDGVEAAHDASSQEEEERPGGFARSHDDEPPLSLGRLVEREADQPEGSE